MNTVHIKGVPPYDGDYELDERLFNAREIRWIKQIAGYLPLEMGRGFKGGDPDLVVVLAVIALERAGKIDRDEGLEIAERFSELPLTEGRIRLRLDDEEDDASPPASMPEPDEPSPSASSSSEKPDGEPLRIASARLD